MVFVNTSPDPELPNKVVIKCRWTRFGAQTYVQRVKVKKGRVRVVRRNFSKSGTHWEEWVYFSKDFTGEVWVVDITNSGKNQSYKLIFEDGALVRREPLFWEQIEDVRL